MQNRRIAVCSPGDTFAVPTAAVFSIANIDTPEGCEVRWFRGSGWCQARRRIHAAEQALDWGAERIACLDLDQVYEPDILKRLSSRLDEGYRMVAAMVPARGYVAGTGMKPFQRLAWRLEQGAFTPVDPDEGEMVRAEFPTSAAIMFHAEDLQRLSQPWYFFTYKPDTWRQVHGEDGTFALRMKKELDVDGWVDTTIRVRHIHSFEIDETFPRRFEDWKTPGVGDSTICGYGESS